MKRSSTRCIVHEKSASDSCSTSSGSEVTVSASL